MPQPSAYICWAVHEGPAPTGSRTLSNQILTRQLVQYRLMPPESSMLVLQCCADALTSLSLAAVKNSMRACRVQVSPPTMAQVSGWT